MNSHSLTLEGIEFNEGFAKAFGCFENTGEHVFVTGPAGTGKSTLLEYFRRHTTKSIVVLAPTGVAAHLVKGQTIHSFFHFKPDITPDKVQQIRLRKQQKRIFEALEAIVIDEISMVRADLMDCVDTFLRIFGREPGKPFGGVQMIMIGDLYQLPPVVTAADSLLFESYYESPYFFDAKVFKDMNLRVIGLTKVYRQKDEGFLGLLNAVRNHTLSAEELDHLNTRVAKDFIPPADDFYVYLTTTNQMADRINHGRLEQLGRKSLLLQAKISGDINERQMPVAADLVVKTDAQVMLVNNDSQGRWMNGSVGRIIDVVEMNNEHHLIRVQLTNGSVVEVTPFTWEIFKFFYNSDSESVDSESIGAFTQYPIRLAWAITIHKSQGKTFEKVIIDTGDGAFAHGQMYVALSRCTRLDGIVLRRKLRRSDLILDERILNFLSVRPADTSERSIEV